MMMTMIVRPSFLVLLLAWPLEPASDVQEDETVLAMRSACSELGRVNER